jgi:hypothetical protein
VVSLWSDGQPVSQWVGGAVVRAQTELGRHAAPVYQHYVLFGVRCQSVRFKVGLTASRSGHSGCIAWIGVLPSWLVALIGGRASCGWLAGCRLPQQHQMPVAEVGLRATNSPGSLRDSARDPGIGRRPPPEQ